jgi:type I restriction enzyme, S subunit
VKGWERKSIGEVCTVVNGGTPKTNIAKYWAGAHLWITPAEMGKRQNPYVDDTSRKLTKSGLEDCSAKLLPANSVILSSRAPIGHLVINTAPMATNQGCKGLVPNKGLDSKFLFYYLGSIVDILNDLGTGATFKELSGAKLKEVLIPFPSLPEQRRIVAILDEAFAGLDAMRANAEKNLQNARDLFDSYLNAVFSEKGEGWVETTLGEIADFKNGLNFTQSSKGEIIRIVGVKDFKNFFWIPDDGLDSVQIDGTLGPAYELRENDILTVRSNGNKQLIGRCILAGPVSEKTSHSGFTIRMRIKSTEIEPRFLVRYLKSAAIHNSLIESGDGANISSLNQKALTALPIMFPSRDSQQSIITRFDELEVDSDRLQSLYRQKLAAISELKQSILQKAFTGELTTSESIAA